MKKLTLLVFIFGGLLMTSMSAAVVQPAGPPDPPAKILNKPIASLKIRDVQKLLGRKLTIKEKIAFLILRHKAKHSDGKNLGESSLAFGIMAIASLIIAFFVPYVILGSLVFAIIAIVLGSVARKRNPSDEKAMVGRLLGWITLGLIALLFIIAAIALASGGWW